jgi:hypothetical protein
LFADRVDVGRFVIRTVNGPLELGWTADGVTVALNLSVPADCAADATRRIVSETASAVMRERRAIMSQRGR